MSAATPKRVDRILELLEGHERQRSEPSQYAEHVAAAGWCWRCESARAVGDVGLCPSCSAYLKSEPARHDRHVHVHFTPAARNALAERGVDGDLLPGLRAELEEAHRRFLDGIDPSDEELERLRTGFEELAAVAQQLADVLATTIVPIFERLLDVIGHYLPLRPIRGPVGITRRETYVELDLPDLRRVAIPTLDLRSTMAPPRVVPDYSRRRT